MTGLAASIALVPLENLSGDPSQDHLAPGFVDDIATELSRFGTLEVVYPRAVAWMLRQSGPDAEPSVVATALLHGSVRRTGDAIRISAQLIEARTARQLWADRYDVTAGNLFAVQDEIVSRIAGALETQSRGAGARRARPDRRGLVGSVRTAGPVARSGQRGRTRAVGRDVAHAQRHQEDRRRPSTAWTPSGERRAHGHVLRLSA
jgi:TolB-like protein